MTSTDTFLDEVLHGLSLPQKTLSPKWLYDDIGSALFEDITRVKEYYPTRVEADVFSTAFPALSDQLGDGIAIAEYGSGASVKTRRLLDAVQPEVYVPIDIAADFLADAAKTLQADYPNIDVVPVIGDFTRPIPLPDKFLSHADRLGFFPGSTIGNMPSGDAAKFLRDARATLGDGARFLLGADLIKDVAVLEAAYDDAAGVTASFNLNLLTRMNRELNADFKRDLFTHRAVFNHEKSRIEMHLVASQAHKVTIQGHDFQFDKGETIHTENSHKFTVDSIRSLAAEGGWNLETYWTDERDWFGVFLLN